MMSLLSGEANKPLSSILKTLLAALVSAPVVCSLDKSYLDALRKKDAVQTRAVES